MKRQPRIVALFQRVCDENLAFWRKEVCADDYYLRRPGELFNFAMQIRNWLHGASQMAAALARVGHADGADVELACILTEARTRLAAECSWGTEWLRIAKEVHDEF